jgi:hypothetical protein
MTQIDDIVVLDDNETWTSFGESYVMISATTQDNTSFVPDSGEVISIRELVAFWQEAHK